MHQKAIPLYVALGSILDDIVSIKGIEMHIPLLLYLRLLVS
jgi:hypothetical protein